MVVELIGEAAVIGSVSPSHATDLQGRAGKCHSWAGTSKLSAMLDLAIMPGLRSPSPAVCRSDKYRRIFKKAGPGDTPRNCIPCRLKRLLTLNRWTESQNRDQSFVGCRAINRTVADKDGKKRQWFCRPPPKSRSRIQRTRSSGMLVFFPNTCRRDASRCIRPTPRRALGTL